MRRRLFSQISPFTYKISVRKGIVQRKIKDAASGLKLALTFSEEPLNVEVYAHKSLIRRTLGHVDPSLQENKAVNLSLSAPKINGILIRPGETFSFWSLAGPCREKSGYREGLTISGGVPGKGIGGGMCQMTNLIHWMVLHSPLTVTELHHHNKVDLFPDFNRQVPFGTGTSIFYNYLDYRFENRTNSIFQLQLYSDEKYLCGRLLCDRELACSYHIAVENEYFSRESDGVFRNNKVLRRCLDKKTGRELSREVIAEAHAKIQYDESYVRGEIVDKSSA